MVILKKILVNFFFNFSLFNLFLVSKRTVAPSILFYEGIVCAIISTTIIIVTYINKTESHNILLHNIYTSLISFLIILSFHTTVITIVDRSISVYIISQINEGINDKPTLKKNFSNTFKDNGIKKRIEEQIEINNIVISDNGFSLTTKGKFYNRVFKIIGKMSKTDNIIIGSENIE